MFKKSYEIPIKMANEHMSVPRFHIVIKDEHNKFLNEFKYHEKLKTLNDIEGIQPLGDLTNIHHSRVANSLLSAAEAVKAEKAEKAAKAAQLAKELSKMKESSKKTEEVSKRAEELLIKTNRSLKNMNKSLKNWKEFKQKELKQNTHLSQKLSQPSSPLHSLESLPSSPRPSSPRSVKERQKDARTKHVNRIFSAKKSVNKEFNRLLKKPSIVEQRRTKLNDLQKELTAISKVMNVKSPKYENMYTLWNLINKLIDELIRNIDHKDYNAKYDNIIGNMTKLRGQILSQGGRRTHKKHKIAKYKTRKNHTSK